MSVENMAETFVRLADTLAADFDSVELVRLLADRCVDTLEVDAAGVLLADRHSDLHVAGASSDRARLVELFELRQRRGPCVECALSGAPVTVADFTQPPRRWPEFCAIAAEAGFRAVHALPMRLREQTIGALNLFTTAPGALSTSTVRVAQAMADVATISLLQAKLLRRQELLAEQLQGALRSRVLVEQAKGVLAERLRIGMGPAFETLRRYSRSHNQRVSAVAESVIAGEVDLTCFTPGKP